MSIFEPFTFRADIFPIILKVHDELLFPGQSNVLTPHLLQGVVQLSKLPYWFGLFYTFPEMYRLWGLMMV